VLAGRAQLARAVQRAPRHPGLRVVTIGGTSGAAGVLHTRTLRDVLAVLRRQADYVVIEAPATSTSADAQSVASLADAAILAVELRRTRYEQVSDAAEQLRRVGTAVLGAVVLPGLGKGGRTPLPSLAQPTVDHLSEFDEVDDADLLNEYDEYDADFDDADPYDADPYDPAAAAGVEHRPVRAGKAPRMDGRTDSRTDSMPTMILAIDRRRDGSARRRTAVERPPGARTPDRPGVDTSVLALTGLDMNGLGRSAEREPDDSERNGAASRRRGASEPDDSERGAREPDDDNLPRARADQ
jgi:hypothetical protein